MEASGWGAVGTTTCAAPSTQERMCHGSGEFAGSRLLRATLQPLLGALAALRALGALGAQSQLYAENTHLGPGVVWMRHAVAVAPHGLQDAAAHLIGGPIQQACAGAHDAGVSALHAMREQHEQRPAQGYACLPCAFSLVSVACMSISASSGCRASRAALPPPGVVAAPLLPKATERAALLQPPPPADEVLAVAPDCCRSRRRSASPCGDMAGSGVHHAAGMRAAAHHAPHISSIRNPATGERSPVQAHRLSCTAVSCPQHASAAWCSTHGALLHAGWEW